VALFGACLAATLLNPYHARLYAVIVEYATQPVAYRLDSEHTALGFRAPWDWAVLALAGAAAFALGRRARPSTFEVLLLVISAYVSFHSQRDIWFVVLAALALLAPARRGNKAVVDRFAVTWPRALLVAGTIGLVLLVTGWSRRLSEEHLEQAVATSYPVRAADVVAERGYAGPLYNHFDWGGYLIWRLPGLPVAMDGRTNVHGDERLQRSCKETWAGRRGWDSDPDLKAAGLVIAEAKGALASLLRLHSRFELVYEDTIAAVFVARRANAGQKNDKRTVGLQDGNPSYLSARGRTLGQGHGSASSPGSSMDPPRGPAGGVQAAGHPPRGGDPSGGSRLRSIQLIDGRRTPRLKLL
jgi:hypothetical protein